MYVKKASLINFRNYEREVFEFSNGTNVIYGNNAQGKTNILEAVYMAALGKSPRTKSDRELIKFGSDYSRITIDFSDDERDYIMRMQLLKSGKKSVMVNNVPLKKLSQLMNYLNVVMFSPDDLDLVKGSPSARRSFADSVISQMYPSYMQSLITCAKNTAQKNSLLKVLRKSLNFSDPTLSVWNEQIAHDSAKIVKYRSEFAKVINEFAHDVQNDISGENMKFSYQPNISGNAEEYFNELENNSHREILNGASLCGVGRDDFKITIDEKDAKLYASQGQQRTAVLALKIASADFINQKKEEYPVLLLDDIMSELDSTRREYLSERIKNRQVIITCTDAEVIKETSAKLFKIENGHIVG